MNSDFIFSQLRVALLAIIAYGAGAGWFTPAESTLFVALISSLGPLVVPLAMSWYANYNTKHVPINSVAAAVDKVENIPGISPEKIAQVAKTAATATALIICLLFSFSEPSFAQTKPSPFVSVLPKLIADAQAALNDATNHSDTIAANCYSAIITVATAQQNAQNTTGGGALLVFQKVRNVARLNATPQGTGLIIGCAALVQDAKMNMVQFFTNFGGAILIKGLLIP